MKGDPFFIYLFLPRLLLRVHFLSGPTLPTGPFRSPYPQNHRALGASKETGGFSSPLTCSRDPKQNHCFQRFIHNIRTRTRSFPTYRTSESNRGHHGCMAPLHFDSSNVLSFFLGGGRKLAKFDKGTRNMDPMAHFISFHLISGHPLKSHLHWPRHQQQWEHCTQSQRPHQGLFYMLAGNFVFVSGLGGSLLVLCCWGVVPV